MDLLALIESLPKDLCDAVVLRVIAGLSLSECANWLKTSIPTVKRRCRKGLMLLRRRLEREPAEELDLSAIVEGGERNVPALE